MTTNFLAGPILRRVTADRVCVWIATHEFIDLRLEVLASDESVLGVSTAVEKPSPTLFPEQCCQLGERLFVYLLQARCSNQAGYPRDQLLYYRLLQDGRALDLSGLAYGDDDDPKYPGFFIPTILQKLLHGSCRKPHGGGNSPDALSYGDDILTLAYRNLERRPAVLLLTGDQIYADDVAVSVASMLKEPAVTLTGKQELIPAIDPNDKKRIWINPYTEALNGRKDLLKQYRAGFSSGESQNHLLSFGEFAAMYLYTFGNAPQWKRDEEWPPFANTGITKNEFDQQCASVRKFEQTLQTKVRRLLANIPTYMLLDDHDVTDDWNITNLWYDRVGGSDLGKRVVSNALAACFAFQGWGNDPDNFDQDLRRTISQQLLDEGQNQASEDIGKRYDLHTWAHRCWGFSVPTNPPIIAIDSRTQRAQAAGNLPVLLDRYARDWLRLECNKLSLTWNQLNTSPPRWPVFITATPVMGLSTVEQGQKLLYWLVKRLEDTAYAKIIEKLLGRKEGWLTEKAIEWADIETWTGNRESLEVLIKCVLEDMKIDRCVFLSGDVHYGFTAVGRYSMSNNVFQCYQLVSSALKNNMNKKQQRTFTDISNPSTLNKMEKLLSSFSLNLSVHLLAPTPGNPVKPVAHQECNLGILTFRNEQPVEHALLKDGDFVEWVLQPGTDFSAVAPNPWQRFRQQMQAWIS